MEPVFGNHVGIVVNSNPDPEGRGRVQVFVPHISTTLFENWNREAKDISIEQGSLAGIPQSVLERLQKNLPWAECAFPLFGSGGSTYADAATGLTRLSQMPSAPQVNTTGTNAVSPDSKTKPVIIDDEKISSPEANSASTSSSSSGMDPKAYGLTNNEILYAMRIAASETGAGVQDPSWVYDQATNWSKAVKNSGSMYTQYGVRGVDVGYTQSNQANVEETGLTNLNNGSYKDQIISTALEMRVRAQKNATAKSTLEAIQAGNFAAADSVIGGPNQNITIGTKYFGLVNQKDSANKLVSTVNSKYGGDALSALDGINASLKPTGDVYQIAGGSPLSSLVTNTAGTALPTSYVGKILDSTRQLPTTDLRTPNGINSTPLPGTFVWCFFLGGDVQKPVYFAGVTERNARARTRSIPSAVLPGSLSGTLTQSSLANSSGTLISGGASTSSSINPGAGLSDTDFANRLAEEAYAAAQSGTLLGNGKDRNGGRCFAGVKTALTDIGVFDSYPDSASEQLGLAKNAGILYEQAGLTNVSANLADAQKGDIIVYNVPSDSSAAGHTEIVTEDNSGKRVFASDKIYQNAASVNSNKYVITGIYRKTS